MVLMTIMVTKLVGNFTADIYVNYWRESTSSNVLNVITENYTVCHQHHRHEIIEF